jgi:hypothetical protein
VVIITFDAMVKEVLKLTKIRELRGGWIKISPHGGTRLYDAVDFAASQYLRRLPGRTAVVERATTYLRDLAEKTGGRHYRAEDIGDLSPAFASIVKELSYQYSLGYYPTRPPQPGERRRIRVRVSRSDLVIHTRDSYVFKSPEAKQAEPK